MTDEKPRIDPRYDPAFQRGFAGEVRSAPRARAVTPARSPLPAPPAAEPAPASTVDANPVAQPPHPEPGPPPAAATRGLARNPFLLALVVLGLALTIGGGAWANQARQLVSVRGGAGSELDYWFLQASVVGAPLTIIAGIAILAGVLFVAAAAWNRRPVDPEA
jgi:hypothetical protein